MEFRIKKLGEDNNDDANENPNVDEINNLASTGQDEPVISPSSEKSKLQLRSKGSSTSGPKLQLREEHQYGSKSAADQALGGLKCKNCGAEIEPETIICVSCGFNLKSGKNLQTKVKKTKAPRKSGPAKVSSGKKKSSIFNLANFILLLVVMGVLFLVFVRPALQKAKQKAVAAKCRVQIKSILTTISLGGGKIDSRLFVCPDGFDYNFYDNEKMLHSEHRMILCHHHRQGGYSSGAVKEMSKKDQTFVDEIDIHKFLQKYNINQADPRDSLDKDFNTARAKFKTKLLTQVKETEPNPIPPKGVLDLVRYKSTIGEMDAYLSPDPKDGKKHPAIVWIHGGFSTALGSYLWEKADPQNDQSAAQFRKAGVITMYPSFRGGGSKNAGHSESYFGEIDDCLAAINYLSKVPYVDKKRIYLAGHSTGGTMALLVAAAAGKDVRAVFSFGPVEDMRGYGQDYLLFDVYDKKEWMYRAPVLWLQNIKAKTFIMEGETGNHESLMALKDANKNKLVSVHPIKNHSHFSLLAPVNTRVAKAILKDTGSTCNIKFPFK